MGLNQLKEELIADAMKEADSLFSQASEEKRKILREAEQQKKALLKQAEQETAKLIADEKKERLAAMQLKAKRVLSEAKEASVNANLAIVWREFAKTRNQKDYAGLMAKLIKQGQKALGSEAIVSVNAKDKALAGRHTKKLDRKAADIQGGAIISSADGRIRVDNSLEALFEEHKEELRKQIFLELFAKKPRAEKISVSRLMAKPMKTVKKATSKAKTKAKQKARPKTAKTKKREKK